MGEIILEKKIYCFATFLWMYESDYCTSNLFLTLVPDYQNLSHENTITFFVTGIYKY